MTSFTVLCVYKTELRAAESSVMLNLKESFNLLVTPLRSYIAPFDLLIFAQKAR